MSKEVRYLVTFENKRDALARIEYLMDEHENEDNVSYVECEGCDKCTEIEHIRKSYLGDIFGKQERKKKGENERTLTKEKIQEIKALIAAGDRDYIISRELNISLNTVEFYRRLMVRDKNNKERR
ncbi:hypothetical protein ACTFR8_22030 [Bacillus cereus group sp. MYBK15-3]|uniref:hypothetical protein n=1 Tax=Bacillus cereus group TaxID=86661 RepID=UPI001C8C7B6C|nr:hypothetical protein [Bacillus cereus]MBX9158279.1 hypothetical protein [Bacillus cereus]